MTAFLDSNTVLYAMGDDPSKSLVANRLLADSPWISTQVINECSHVLRRRLGWPPARVAAELEVVLKLVTLHDVGIEHIRAAWRISEHDRFSHFDSLIIAVALAADCSTLYTEDMQHGQVIDGRLTLINPFLPQATP